jgi:hypothetical protein
MLMSSLAEAGVTALATSGNGATPEDESACETAGLSVSSFMGIWKMEDGGWRMEDEDGGWKMKGERRLRKDTCPIIAGVLENEVQSRSNTHMLRSVSGGGTSAGDGNVTKEQKM